jgi:hypothetical protein
MCFVITQPKPLGAASTPGGVSAAVRDVSASTAAQFAMHGQTYSGMSTRAMAVHKLFVATLPISASSFAAGEAANAIAAD